MNQTPSQDNDCEVTVQGYRKQSFVDCPESVSGHAQNDRSGRCCWCGRQVDPPVAMPRHLGRTYRTELDMEYRRFYDPDFGTDPWDR